jgi:4-aminobutyrate aminotransferase-like enzyme
MTGSETIVTRFRRLNTAQTALRFPFLGAAGSGIVGQEGRNLIDFTSGYGVTGTGWHAGELVRAVQKHVEERSYAPPWMATEEALALSERLLAAAGNFPGKCVRATGGADAIEQIVKAVSCARRGKFLCFEYAYHGGTTFTLALSDVRRHRLPAHHLVAEQPRLPAPICLHCPWNRNRDSCKLACAEAVENQLAGDGDIAAVIIEPILGSGGVIVPPEGFLKSVQESCRRHGAFFIVDEVMTGFGRAGCLCLSTSLGLEPDAIAFGKGLGAGYVPIGAALVSDKLAHALERYEDSSATFAWTPLACRMALANLDFLEQNHLCERSAETGDNLRSELEKLVRDELPGRVCQVRGKGLMIGLEFGAGEGGGASPSAFCRRVALEAVNRGLMLASSWDWKTLVILPPLTIDRETVRRALDLLRDSLRDASGRHGG